MFKKVIIALLGIVLISTGVSSNVWANDTQCEVDYQTEGSSEVQGFVSRMYERVLGRNYDEEGFAFWVNGLIAGDFNGAMIAGEFVFSEEFVAKNLSDEEFLRVLYLALFDREPDEAGFDVWLSLLENGVTRRWVCSEFIGSEEFKILCERYKIVPGSVKLTDYADQYPQITMFVHRCYKEILNRMPDESGLNNWVAQLACGGGEGALIIESFALSEEMLLKDLSNEAYVTMLYKSVLGRKPDETGLGEWLKLLDKGITRRFLCSGFVASEEFEILCNRYGILPGSIALESPIELNPTAAMYIFSCYNVIFDRKIDEAELNMWTGELNSGNMTMLEIIRKYILSYEYKLKNVSDEEFVSDLYKVIYETECDEEKIAELLIILENNNGVREFYFEEFTKYVPANALGVNSIAYVFIGDSRFLEMNTACRIEECSERYFTKSLGGAGYYWFATEAVPWMEGVRNAHPEIKTWCLISGMGVNDLENYGSYRMEYERLHDEGYELYLLSVNPLLNDPDTFVWNNNIQVFNTRLQSISKAIYMDSYSYLLKNGFTTYDRLHYTDETYMDIFNYIRSFLLF